MPCSSARTSSPPPTRDMRSRNLSPPARIPRRHVALCDPMTTYPRESISTRDPDTQPIPAVRTGERQRAAIALGVLAIVALIVVGVMVAVLGSNNNNSPTTNGAPTGPPVTVISHQPSAGP